MVGSWALPLLLGPGATSSLRERVVPAAMEPGGQGPACRGDREGGRKGNPSAQALELAGRRQGDLRGSTPVPHHTPVCPGVPLFSHSLGRAFRR